MFFINLIFTSSSEWTGYGHIQCPITRTRNDVTNSFSELIAFQYFIALLDIIITNLTISNQDNFLKFFIDDLFRNNFGRCSSFARSGFDLELHLFLGDVVDI